MQQMLDVVGRIDALRVVKQKMKRIKDSGLALTDQGISRSGPIVPEWKFTRLKPLGVVSFLRKVVRIHVPADEPATFVQRQPEDKRQSKAN